MLTGFSSYRCGLIGGRLSHSFSPPIHAALADYEYKLYPMPPEDVPKWFADCPLDGFNVTIPYKETVMPFCAALSDRARRIGSVNTVVKRPDGSFFGDNTDYAGFSRLLDTLGVPAEGKKALILGSGGSCRTVRAVLADRGAREIVVISRKGPDNYENLSRHADAQLIVNTTPVGMYPDTGKAPLDLAGFPALEGVLDLIYNPARTPLLLQAEALGIPCRNGLAMLVCQAAEAARVFTGVLPDGSDAVVRALSDEMRNIILIGMPGCGKTSCGRALSARTGRPFSDSDEAILEKTGRRPSEIIRADGEAAFRAVETGVLQALAKESGTVIATGGGAVTVPGNRDILRQNGVLVFLERPLAALATEDRPLSADLEALYAARLPLYRAFADAAVPCEKTPEETAAAVLRALEAL